MKAKMMKAALVASTALVAAATHADAADDILVGLIAGTTGAYGSTGVATVNGATLAVEKINAAGGVLGRKIKLESYNDNASATLSGQFFAKLVKREG